MTRKPQKTLYGLILGLRKDFGEMNEYIATMILLVALFILYTIFLLVVGIGIGRIKGWNTGWSAYEEVDETLKKIINDQRGYLDRQHNNYIEQHDKYIELYQKYIDLYIKKLEE